MTIPEMTAHKANNQEKSSNKLLCLTNNSTIIFLAAYF
jgi:hypothetical protein